MASAKTTTRRRFLRHLALGLPAMAAGGALAHIGLTAGRRKNGSSAFPGDPTVWREKFLEQARAERGGSAAVDVIEAPARPSDVPLVMEPGQGPIPIARPAQQSRAKKADLVRMQEELGRAMEKPIDQRKWIMVIDLQKCIG
ncbi:MAG: hypothetical protein ACE5IZ_09205, partial [Dehalococcoidia bacterium]